MTAPREEVKECDTCGGTWGFIREDEHDNYWDCIHELTTQRNALRARLAAAEMKAEADHARFLNARRDLNEARDEADRLRSVVKDIEEAKLALSSPPDAVLDAMMRADDRSYHETVCSGDGRAESLLSDRRAARQMLAAAMSAAHTNGRNNDGR